MSNVILVGETYSQTVSEHTGKTPGTSGTVSGVFNTGTPKLKVAGVEVLLDGIKSTETCYEDSGGYGTLKATSSKVKCNGVSVGRVGDTVTMHQGTIVTLSGGNNKLNVN